MTTSDGSTLQSTAGGAGTHFWPLEEAEVQRGLVVAAWWEPRRAQRPPRSSRDHVRPRGPHRGSSLAPPCRSQRSRLTVCREAATVQRDLSLQERSPP